MAQTTSSDSNKDFLVADDHGRVSARRGSLRDSKGGQGDSNHSTTAIETSEERNPPSLSPRSTASPENSLKTSATSRASDSHKLKKAFEAMRRVFSRPKRAAKNGEPSGKDTSENTNTRTETSQSSQVKAIDRNQQKHELPRSARTYPLRSAFRGNRPRRATDSARRVHFAEQGSVSQNGPYPMRSAMRGSRPRKARDSSRRIRFDLDA